MDPKDVKKLLINSLNPDADTKEAYGKLEEEGVSYDFSDDFIDKVLTRLFSAGIPVYNEMEFVKSLNSVFYRVALTGVAAIVILMISIFLMEGSFSFNSFFGLSDSYYESVVCLLTGK